MNLNFSHEQHTATIRAVKECLIKDEWSYFFRWSMTANIVLLFLNSAQSLMVFHPSAIENMPMFPPQN